MYAKFAPYYDKVGWDKYSYRLFHKLLPLLREKGGKDVSLLDLGCGTGTLVLEAAKHGFSADGVDISREMIEVARSKDNQGQANFYVADICSFKTDRQYDFITCFYTLDHLVASDRLLSAFVNIRQYLRDGGNFIFDIKDKIGFDNRNPGFRKKTPNYLVVRRSFSNPLTGLVTKKLLLLVKNDHQKCVTIRGNLKERGYSKQEIREVLTRAGLIEEQVIDLGLGDPQNNAEKRVFWQVK